MKVLENQQHQQYPDVLNGALLAIRISKHKSTGFICRPYYVQSTRNVRQELMQEFPYIYAPVQTTAVAFGKKRLNNDNEMGVDEFEEVIARIPPVNAPASNNWTMDWQQKS